MASADGVYAVCEAIVRVLRANRRPDDFGGEPIDIEVYAQRNFDTPMSQGVSLFLYRLYHNGTHRTPPGRLTPLGRQRTRLPVDLHFLLTAWAQTASRQHEIAGWMMRVMEDNATLTAGALNAPRRDVFDPDEAVEVVLAELSTEDLFRIWEVVTSNVYQLSVPYVARRLEIESTLVVAEGGPVIERIGDLRQIRSERTAGTTDPAAGAVP